MSRRGEYEIEGVKDDSKSRYLATREDLILDPRWPVDVPFFPVGSGSLVRTRYCLSYL